MCERNRCPRPRGRRKSVAEVEEAGNRSSSPRTSPSFRGGWTATACSAVANRTRRIRQDGARASSGESIEERTCLARGFCPAHGRGTRTVDVCQTVGDARRHCRRAHSMQVGCICKDIGKLDTQSFQREQHGPLMWAPRLIRHQCGFLGVRVGEASNPGPPKGQQNKRHRSRCWNGARDQQQLVSSDDEPLVARSVAFTDLDATGTTALSSTTPASSQALVRVQPISGAEVGSDEDLLLIGQQVEGSMSAGGQGEGYSAMTSLSHRCCLPFLT